MLGVCVVCLFCFVFFFFKQKTAYEMRISDWSSDVCSSDLPLENQHAFRLQHSEALGKTASQILAPVFTQLSVPRREPRARPGMHQVRRIKSNKPERGVGIWQVAEVQHHVRLNAQGALASRVAARVVGDCQRLAAHVDRKSTRLNSSH